MKKLLSLSAILFFSISAFAQKWEKIQPNILFAHDKNGNINKVKIGIGTNNPTQRLDVNGRTRFRGNSSFDSSLTSLSVQAQSANFTTAVINGQLSVLGNIAMNGNLQLANLSGAGDRVVMVDSNGVFKDFPNPCPGLNAFWKTDGNIVPLTCDPFIGTLNSFDFNIRTNNIQRMTVTMVR